MSLKEIWPHALCFAVLSVRLVVEAWHGLLTIWGEQGASAVIAYTKKSSNWCSYQTPCQGRKALQRPLANQSPCLGSKWPGFTGLWCTCWGDTGCLHWVSARRTLHTPVKAAETGTRHFPGMLLCKCSFDINHWICFAIFIIQLSFGEWWLFQAFRCWGWTKAWRFNDSHVAPWHLWTQCLLYFAYSIASAVFSQNLDGMPHAGWIIFIYVVYLLRYPSSSKTSWQTFSSFSSGVLAAWADSDAFQYTYFLIPLTCRT